MEVDFVIWIKCFARFYRKGYLSYLFTTWLPANAGLTPELDPIVKPPPTLEQTGGNKNKKRKKYLKKKEKGN